MAGKYLMGLTDFDGDNKQVSYPVESPLSDGSDLATWNAGLNALRDSINAISAGQFNVDGRTANYTRFENGSATTPIAQAKYRAIIQYQDTVTTKTFQDLNIPMPDLGLADTWIVQGEFTVLDLASTVGAAFVTAFEANVISPEGNAVEILRVYIEE